MRHSGDTVSPAVSPRHASLSLPTLPILPSAPMPAMIALEDMHDVFSAAGDSGDDQDPQPAKSRGERWKIPLLRMRSKDSADMVFIYFTLLFVPVKEERRFFFLSDFFLSNFSSSVVLCSSLHCSLAVV